MLALWLPALQGQGAESLALRGRLQNYQPSCFLDSLVSLETTFLALLTLEANRHQLQGCPSATHGENLLPLSGLGCLYASTILFR